MTDRATAVVVLAKEPLAGRVKTRLQTQFSAEEAAALAAAALGDTLAAVRGCAAQRRVLAWEGDPTGWQDGWEWVAQPSGTLNDRLTAAFAAVLTGPAGADAGRTGSDMATGASALLVGMDTPQVWPDLLNTDWEGADAVLGLSDDGGFWAIGLRAGHPDGVFDGVPMSTDRTGSAQLARLFALGLSVKLLPPLRDVDLPEDADHIAYEYPDLSFSRTYAALLRGRAGAPPNRRDAGSGPGVGLGTGKPGAVGAARAATRPGEARRWSAEADEADLLVVSRCEPPVIDLGCGPGRMVRALGQAGFAALGVDISAVAVTASNERGGLAVRRRIEQALPGEGRWGTALLMDGNVALGGDLAALLERCRRLVAPGGLIICEVDPGEVDPAEVDPAECGPAQNGPAGAVLGVALALDLLLVEEWTAGARSFLALRSGSGAG